MKTFYQLLANTVFVSTINFTVWFAITFFVFLQTQSVFATSILSGLYLVATASTGFWLGSIVDHNKKKDVMIISMFLSLLAYAASFALYITADQSAFQNISSVTLWTFVPLLMTGVISGNVRNIALPTLITTLVAEDRRDKANGLAGTVGGVGFLVTSVISGLLVGHSGMYWVLILAVAINILGIIHLWLLPIPEDTVELKNEEQKKIDIRGTIKAINAIPGLFALILFTTINNFLGGVFMSLLDAYGLSMVSVQVWGLLWGFLSTAFIIGGLIIAKWGLGKNPLRALFIANIIIWTISCFFTIYPSIFLVVGGMFIYLCVVPYIEAAEHTIIQKVVPAERQGRVFGFAQSVEQAASPITAFAIGPIAQFIFIPFMTTGAGVELIGDWFGTGPARGIALVFTLTGFIGLIITLLAFSSKYYRQLSKSVTR
ncbi:MFS transporter [Patescibacteria group bacterium]|nr:MFS transporter [Patescibacteria group bacterium]